MNSLVIPVYERPEYLRQTLDSIMPYLPLNFRMVIADDGSVDPRVHSVVRSHRLRPWDVFTKGINVGVALNMLRALETCKGSKVIITLDSDFIIKRRFFDALTAMLSRYGNEDTIITGFNASSHPITKQCEGFAEKKTIGGGNLCFSWQAYEKHIRPSLMDSMWDWRMCDSVNKSGGRFLCVTPSICQHIGTISTLGHTSSDKAEDF